MEDRLTALEHQIGALNESLRTVERRLRALEDAAGNLPVDEPAADAVAPPLVLGAAPSAASLLSLVGRGFLVLGGAYLVRALTDAGTFPPPAGVALGLAYSVVWIALADRSGARGERLTALVHGVLGVAIGYPLVWEASTRFGVLPPVAAAATLGLLTALVLAAAWRRDLEGLAWTAVLAAVGGSVGLAVATRALDVFGLLLLVLGAGVLWLTYGERWHGLRWPLALAADAVILVLTLLVSGRGGPPEEYRGLSAGRALALALALFAVYLGSFSVRTLAKRRDVTLFELVQTMAALLVGFGGAVRIARAVGLGAGLLGGVALGLAVACYAVAFAFVERDLGPRNFLFYSSLGLVLTLSASELVTGTALLAVFWGGLGLAAAFLGGRFDRVTLRSHAAVYLAAAALETGLLAGALDAFLGAATAPLLRFTTSALLVLGATFASLAVLAISRPGKERPWPARIPVQLITLLTVLGGGALAIQVLASAVPGPSGDAGRLALVRTGVLVTGATVLAATRGFGSLRELTALAYPVLVAAGVKVLLEDLRVGRPATLFPAFALYGLALLVVPRVLRGRAVVTTTPPAGATSASAPQSPT